MPDLPPSRLPDFAASRARSFRYAFAGLGYVLRTQHNAWLHALASVGVLAVGLWVELSRLEWALIVLAMALVWAAEIVNTALEALVNLASPQPHPLARIAKDCSAAAVLVMAGAAAVIGVLILGPSMWDKLGL